MMMTDCNEIKIFRVATVWKVFMATASPPMAGLFSWVMVMPFTGERTDHIGLTIFFVLLGASFTLLFVVGLIEIFKAKVEIYPDRIRKVGAFKSEELRFDEISSFDRISGKNVEELYLRRRDGNKKGMRIVLLFERKQELIESLKARLAKHGDKVGQQTAGQATPKSTMPDETRAQHSDSSLQQARWAAKLMQIITIAVVLWAVFYPHPYAYAIWASVLLPLVALAVVRYFGNVLSSDPQASNDVSYVFLLPGFALALRAIVDWNILGWDKFWLPFLAITAVLSALLYLRQGDNTRAAFRKTWLTLLLPVACMPYVFGSIITLNGTMDSSPSDVYQAEVVGKKISSGSFRGMDFYYLRLSSWHGNAAEDVDVGRATYEKYEEGDTVHIYAKQGYFGIPWFVVD